MATAEKSLAKLFLEIRRIFLRDDTRQPLTQFSACVEFYARVTKRKAKRKRERERRSLMCMSFALETCF